MAVPVPYIYSWKVSLAARGDTQLGLGFAISAVDVLAVSPVGDTAGVTVAEVEKFFVLVFFGVADLGLVEVTVDAGTVDVYMSEDPSLEPSWLTEVVAAAAPSPAAGVVAAEPSSSVVVVAAEPSSPSEVVMAEPSSPAEVVAAEESDPSPPALAPESSPEPESDVGLALRVEDEDFLEVKPLAKVPVTEVGAFVPLFEIDATLVPLFEMLDTLVPAFEVDEVDAGLVDDLSEFLTDTPLLITVADKLFAVSLLHAIPMQRRLEELELRDDAVILEDGLCETGFKEDTLFAEDTVDTFDVVFFRVELPGFIVVFDVLVVVLTVVRTVVFGVGFGVVLAVVFATLTTGSCNAFLISWEAAEIHSQAAVSSGGVMPWIGTISPWLRAGSVGGEVMV